MIRKHLKSQMKKHTKKGVQGDIKKQLFGSKTRGAQPSFNVGIITVAMALGYGYHKF